MMHISPEWFQSTRHSDSLCNGATEIYSYFLLPLFQSRKRSDPLCNAVSLMQDLELSPVSEYKAL